MILDVARLSRELSENAKTFVLVLYTRWLSAFIIVILNRPILSAKGNLGEKCSLPVGRSSKSI